MRGAVAVLLGMVLSARVTSADSHTYMFLTSVTNQVAAGSPGYFSSHVLENITLYWYDSQTQLLEIRAPWFKKINISLLQVHNIEVQGEKLMTYYLNWIINHLGDTTGYHVLQNLDICTLYGNGTVEVFAADAYDGQLFTTFNVDNSSWTAEVPQAETLVELLNANSTLNEQLKTNLVKSCINQMKKLLTVGSHVLARKKSPIVRVLNRTMSNDSMILDCRAYGHYPRGISMTWDRGGQKIQEESLERMTLPLPECNYLSSLSVTVTPIAGDVYTCTVTHSSMESPLKEMWRVSALSVDSQQHFSDGPSTGVITGISVAVVLLVSLSVFGLVAWERHRRERMLPEIFTDDPSS